MNRSRRVLLLNALLGLGILVVCWAGVHVGWRGPDAEGHDVDGRYGPGPRGPWQPPTAPGPQSAAAAVAWTALPGLVLLAVGVALRWRWPRAAFVASAVGVGVFFGSATFSAPALLALGLTVYPMAVTLPVRRWAWLLALLVPVVLAAHHAEPYLGALDPVLYAELLMALALAVLPPLLVLLRRGRREAERRERAEDLRRTAYEERLRVAREVHDVVGHSLSVVTMQAGVALHVLDKQRATGAAVAPEVTASLEAIRRSSRDALAELRTTLGMFRDPAGEPRTPTAGLDRLADLVGALRAAGRRIDVDGVPVPGPALPAAVDAAAFRIVQEALTNVVRHAGDARAEVLVQRRPDVLVVEVADDGPGPRGFREGNGVRGMRERAAALGGGVEVGPGARGGLVVRAALPLPAPARPDGPLAGQPASAS
ncbi:sensor histidine kinase [Microlunatus flavus]|uniref:histidine kinase n=1 Tax=Microlunatus flavus TaxID=1036181 RepID=A0A1H9N4A6_9ACTN|nr:histidine kinase [Microlunatus flavus]SER30806.1 Signal transduction histidine kinase [Microlunatus flavus]